MMNYCEKVRINDKMPKGLMGWSDICMEPDVQCLSDLELNCLNLDSCDVTCGIPEQICKSLSNCGIPKVVCSEELCKDTTSEFSECDQIIAESKFRSFTGCDVSQVKCLSISKCRFSQTSFGHLDVSTPSFGSGFDRSWVEWRPKVSGFTSRRHLRSSKKPSSCQVSDEEDFVECSELIPKLQVEEKPTRKKGRFKQSKGKAKSTFLSGESDLGVDDSQLSLVDWFYEYEIYGDSFADLEDAESPCQTEEDEICEDVICEDVSPKKSKKPTKRRQKLEVSADLGKPSKVHYAIKRDFKVMDDKPKLSDHIIDNQIENVPLMADGFEEPTDLSHLEPAHEIVEPTTVTYKPSQKLLDQSQMQLPEQIVIPKATKSQLKEQTIRQEPQDIIRPKAEVIKRSKADDIKRPKADDIKRPKADDIKRPKADDIKRTKADDIKRPKDEDVKRLKDEDVKRPKDEDVKRPKYDDIKRPKADDVKRPKDEDVKRPKDEDIRKPKYEDIRIPKYEDIRRPKDEDIRRLKDEDIRRPKDEDIRRPKDEDIRRLKDENIRRLKDEDIRRPKDEDIRRPKDEDIRRPKDKDIRRPKDDIKRTKAEDIKRPKAEDIKIPKAEDIKRPKHEDIQRPKHEDIQRPKHEDIQRPKHEDIKKPKAEDVKRPKHEDIQRPKADDIKRPKAEDVKRPKDEDIKRPKHEDIKRPKHEDIKRPKHEDIKRPKHEDIKRPKHEDIQRPKSDDIKRPKDDIKRPKHEDIQRPKHEDIQKPKHEDIQRPKHEDIQKPKHEDIQRPKHEDIQKPKHEDIQRPKDKDIKRPKDDIQRPKHEDIQRPKDEDIKRFKPEDIKRPKDEGIKRPKDEDIKRLKDEDIRKPKAEVTRKEFGKQTNAIFDDTNEVELSYELPDFRPFRQPAVDEINRTSDQPRTASKDSNVAVESGYLSVQQTSVAFESVVIADQSSRIFPCKTKREAIEKSRRKAEQTIEVSESGEEIFSDESSEEFDDQPRRTIAYKVSRKVFGKPMRKVPDKFRRKTTGQSIDVFVPSDEISSDDEFAVKTRRRVTYKTTRKPADKSRRKAAGQMIEVFVPHEKLISDESGEGVYDVSRRKVVGKVVRKTTDKSRRKPGQTIEVFVSSEEISSDESEEFVDKTPKKVSSKTIRKTTDKSRRKSAGQTIEMVAPIEEIFSDESFEEFSDQTSRKIADKTRRKVARKTTEKSTRKSADQKFEVFESDEVIFSAESSEEFADQGIKLVDSQTSRKFNGKAKRKVAGKSDKMSDFRHLTEPVEPIYDVPAKRSSKSYKSRGASRQLSRKFSIQILKNVVSQTSRKLIEKVKRKVAGRSSTKPVIRDLSDEEIFTKQSSDEFSGQEAGKKISSRELSRTFPSQTSIKSASQTSTTFASQTGTKSASQTSTTFASQTSTTFASQTSTKYVSQTSATSSAYNPSFTDQFVTSGSAFIDRSKEFDDAVDEYEMSKESRDNDFVEGDQMLSSRIVEKEIADEIVGSIGKSDDKNGIVIVETFEVSVKPSEVAKRDLKKIFQAIETVPSEKSVQTQIDTTMSKQKSKKDSAIKHEAVHIEKNKSGAKVWDRLAHHRFELVTNSSFELEMKWRVEALMELLSNVENRQHLEDVVILVGEKKFPCCRFLLAVTSGYFRRLMLEGNMISNSMVTVDLNVSAESFDIVLRWLYTGNANLQLRNIGEVRHIAKQLEMVHLWEYCEETLRVLREHKGDAVTLYEYASERNMEEMAKEAANLAATTFKDIVSNGRYLNYTFEQMALLLSLDNINIESELAIFNAIWSWIAYSWEERKFYRHELIRHVNFLNMTFDDVCSLAEELISTAFTEENPITWGEDGQVMDGLIRGLLKCCVERCQFKVRRRKIYGQNEAAPMIEKFFSDEEKRQVAWNDKIAENLRRQVVKRNEAKNEAAVRIQAAFRGFRVRKEMDKNAKTY